MKTQIIGISTIQQQQTFHQFINSTQQISNGLFGNTVFHEKRKLIKINMQSLQHFSYSQKESKLNSTLIHFEAFLNVHESDKIKLLHHSTEPLVQKWMEILIDPGSFVE